MQHFSTDDGPGIRTTVFLKGCPLRCLWCANPESQQPYPQVAYRMALCIGCSTCIDACSNGAISRQEGATITINRDCCVNCGACALACPSGALFLYGETRTVSDVFEEVRRDSTYYEESGGGVTASGGECMQQVGFVEDLFSLCRDAGIHTALDTCGYFQTQDIDRIMGCTDLVLFDVKAIDSATHKRLTGVGNELILRNLEYMLECGMAVRIRVPIIPGLNDSDEPLGALADYIASLDSGLPVDVLPYHEYGFAKYGLLEMSYALKSVTPADETERNRYACIFDARKLEVTVRK